MPDVLQKRLVVPEWLLKKTLGNIKQMHREGDLLTSLKKDFGTHENPLLEIHYKKEKHDRNEGFSILVLDFEFKTASGNCKKEAVFQYRYDDYHWGEGTIKHWIYPDDAAIPHLSNFVTSPQSLKEIAWNRPLDPLLPPDEKITIERFHHSPAFRVSYLLSIHRGKKKYVIKIVRREDFDSVLNKAEALSRTQIRNNVILPSMLAYSREHSAFLFDYLPGIQVKRIKGDAFTEIKSFFYEEIVRILKLIHQTSIPEIPIWNPAQKEINRLCSLLRPFRLDDRRSHQEAASLVTSIIDPFSKQMKNIICPYNTLIHNTFSMKHLLYQAERSASGTPASLGILDWDSIVLGPKERDIAQILSDLPAEGDDRSNFLNCYQAKTGHDLNLEWIEIFMLYRCLVKKLMKGVRQDDLSDSFLDDLGDICQRITRTGSRV